MSAPILDIESIDRSFEIDWLIRTRSNARVFPTHCHMNGSYLGTVFAKHIRQSEANRCTSQTDVYDFT